MDLVPPQPPKSQFPHYHFSILLAVAVCSIFFTIWAAAGTLTPSGAPGGTMKSLQEIYDSIAGTTFDSSLVPADQNGSLIEGLKYISDNLGWASSSNNMYMLSGGNLGIGTTFPASKLSVQANNVRTDILTIASSSGSEYLSMDFNGHTQITGSAINPIFMAETRGPTPGTTLSGAMGLAIQGKYAYVTNSFRASLAVVDISNPASPSFVAETQGPVPGTSLAFARQLAVSGRYAYVTNFTRASLAVIDISNPANPTFITETRGPLPGTSLSGASDIVIAGKYAYVTNSGRNSLAVIDISNPASPSFVSETRGPVPGTTLGGANDFVISGRYAYVTNSTRASLAVIDISNPASPSFVSETRGPVPGTSLDGSNGVTVSGRYAYVAANTRDSVAVIDISNPANPIFVTETRGPVPGTTFDLAAKVFVSGKNLYLITFGRASLVSLDISNPASPSFVGETRGPIPGTSLNGAMSVVVAGRYAYVTNYLRASLAAIDIGSLSASQVEAGTIRSENLSVMGYATFDNNILLRGGFIAGEGALVNGSFAVSGASSSFMGKLGVGTTTPTTRFEVVGSGGNYDPFNVASSSRSSLFRISKSGNVGIASSSFADKLSLEGDARLSGHISGGNSGGVNKSLYYGGIGFTDSSTMALNEDVTSVTTDNVFGISNNLRVSLSGPSSSYFVGNGNYVQLANTNAGAIDNLYGIENVAFNDSNSNVTNLYGLLSIVANTGTSGNVTNAYGIMAASNHSGGGTVTNSYVMFAGPPQSGPLITNRYGLFVDNQTASGISNAWNVYSDGSNSRNYFAGSVGIGTANPSTKLEIVGGNCADDVGGGGCTADYAELYPASEVMEKGDLIMLDVLASASHTVKKATDHSLIMGVVSSAPAVAIDGGKLAFFNNMYTLDPRRPAVALSGRVPLKVSLENGPVQVGDRLTVSSIPGIAAKAIQPGMTVGIAMEPLTLLASGSYQKILTFVNMSYWMPSGSEQSLHATSPDLQGKTIIASFLEYLERSIISIKKLVTDEIDTKKLKSERVELMGDDGDIYCIRVASGSLQSVKGECVANP